MVFWFEGASAMEVRPICESFNTAVQPVLVSAAFADAVDRKGLVSVGRFALRGVGRPQELFTPDPETDVRT